jgi:hypothetical protein
MKTINEEMGRWVQVILFAALWLLLLALGGHHEISFAALKEIPHVVVIYTILYLIFIKWGWRWRIFRGWLVALPDLQGTWEGTLKSTWVDPETSKTPEPIRATLVICQTFHEITCSLRTGESSSESSAALLSKRESGDGVRLSYVYTNRPMAQARPRSEMHDGAANLELITHDLKRRLEGQYWTGRKTTGDMNFIFKTRAT